MSAPSDTAPARTSSSEVKSLDDLLAPFYAAQTPRGRWAVGTEAEKFGICSDGSALPFEGEIGVRRLLEELASRHGWTPAPEYPGAPLIALRRGGASITLEPGGQLELSGAPLDTIHQTCAELRGHLAELRSVSDPFDIHWLGLGFHPTAKQSELPWVPKLRYGVMKEYLPTRGAMAHDMMRRTATVQANLDYSDEADAMKKLRVALKLQPLATAMFANSPWKEGERSGDKSHRARVWLHMDPDRTGLLPFAFDPNAGYREYVEWALDVPMFLVKRGREVHRNAGQSFRSFMKDGWQGIYPVASDWETHLNTLFPEVRLKNTLEVRGTDSQPQPLICALPALWKGLLYDAQALEAADCLTQSWTFDALEASRSDVAERALQAELEGQPLGDIALEVLSLAESGLARLSNLDGRGRDERIHLAPLRELLCASQCPSDLLLAAVPGRPTLSQLVEHARA